MRERLGDRPDGVAWRCVNCGDVVDRVIARNRVSPAPPERPTRYRTRATPARDEAARRTASHGEEDP